MTSMRTLGLMMLLAMAVPAHAAVRYLIVTEITKEGDTEVISERVTADGDNARVDFVDPDGTPAPDGGFIVTNDGGKTLAVVDDGSAMCGEWSTSELFMAVARMAEKGRKLVNANFKEMTTEKVLEETGEEMLGYPTTRIRLETKYGATGRFMFLKVNYDVEEKSDIWMTTEIEMPQVEEQWLTAATQSGFDYVDQLTESYLAHVIGPVLKEVRTVRLINARSGKAEEKTETMTVRSIEFLDAADLSPETFASPACRPVGNKDLEKQATRMIKKHVK